MIQYSETSQRIEVKEKNPKNGNGNGKKGRESRTLGTIADIFLSAHCHERDCRKSHDRAAFCCRRNFNSRCCNYLYHNHNNNFGNHWPFNNYGGGGILNNYGNSGSWNSIGSYNPYDGK